MENNNKPQPIIGGSTNSGVTIQMNTEKSPEYDSAHNMAYKSYQERYEFAKSKGLSDANAKEFAAATYSTVDDTFWSRFGHFFGGKLSSQKYAESMQEKDAGLLRELLEKQNIQDYDDPTSQVERREAAGLNDALNGGQQIGPGNAGEIDDTTLGADGAISQAVNNEASQQPMKVAESLMACLGGVMNLANAGIGVANSLLEMDISEGSSAFEMIRNIKELGDFFPFLGIQYSPEEKSWAEIEDANHTLSLQQVRGMTKEEFFKRVKKRTGIRTRSYLREMYNAYRAMASPANINAYMQSRLDNMSIQNNTVDAAVAGVGRFGSLTNPTPNFSLPWHNVDKGNTKYTFDKPADQTVFDYYTQKTTDLFLYGLEAGIGEKKQKINETDAQNMILDTCKDLIIRLRTDATIGNSMLAKYLLVNMMSDSFNGIGDAAYMYHSPEIRSVGDAWNTLKDVSNMTFLGLKQMFPSLLGTEISRHKHISSYNRSQSYSEVHNFPHAPRK